MSTRVYTLVDKPYGVKDKKGGLWIYFRVKEAVLYDHIAVSRDYKSYFDPYVQERNTENAISATDDFASEHALTPNEPQYIDGNKIPWIIVETGDKVAAGSHVGATLGYGDGALISSTSESDLKSAIEKYALRAAAEGKIKAPPATPPTPSDIIVKPPPPPPPPAQTNAPLDVSNYAAIGNAALALGARPADLMLVLYAESGLHTWAQAKNKAGEGIALGIGQLTRTGASAIGMSDVEWQSIPAKSFNEQVKIVEKFLRTVARPGSFRDSVAIYQTNFAPATVGSYKLFGPGKEYDANAPYDFNKNGLIDTDDLGTALSARVKEAAFRSHLQKLAAAGFAGDPVIPAPSGGAGGGLGLGGWAFVAAGIGALFWMNSGSGGGGAAGGERRRSERSDDDGDEA